MIYTIYNGPMPTTSALVKVALSANTLKTLLQIKPGTTQIAKIIEWGYSFDGVAAATPGYVELIETDVAATVTAFVANDIIKSDAEALLAGDPTTSLISVGTSASGYTSTSEGTTTASRLLSHSLSAPTTQFIQQFPLGQEPLVQPAKFLRIRATFAAAVNIICYVKIAV